MSFFFSFFFFLTPGNSRTRASQATVSFNSLQDFLVQLPLSWEDVTGSEMGFSSKLNYSRMKNMPEWQVYSGLCVDRLDWQHLR